MATQQSVLVCDKPDHQIGVQSCSPIAWSYDGQYLAYVSGTFSILVYKADETKNYIPFASLIGHAQIVKALLFHPTLPYLISCGNEGFFIWNYIESKLVSVIDENTNEDAHEGSVECLCWGYDGSVLFTGSKDSTIKIWKIDENFKYMETIQGHRSVLLALSFNAATNILVSAGRDSSINIWDTISLSPKEISKREDDKGTNCALITSMDGHLGDVSSLCINTNGTLLFSGARDNSIRAWDLKTKTFIREIKDRNQFQKGCHQGDVRNIYLINNDQFLLSFGNDGEMKLFQLGDLSNTNSDRVGDMMVSIDALLKGFIESDEAKEVINDQLLSSYTIFKNRGVFRAVMNPSLPFFCVSSDSNIIKIFDVSSSITQPILKQEYIGHNDAVTDIAIMDDKHIVSVSKDYSINIYNVNNNSREFNFDFSSTVLNIACADDLLFVTGVDYVVKVYSINKPRYYKAIEDHYFTMNQQVPDFEYELLQYVGHSGKVTAIDSSKELGILVTGSEDFSVRFWHIPDDLSVVPVNRNRNEIPQETCYHTEVLHHGAIFGVNISDSVDGSIYVSTVGNDYTMFTYKMNDEYPELYWTQHNAHKGVVTCCIYGHGATSHIVYTGGWDNKINAWDIKQRKLIVSLQVHTARITELDVSQDGQYLVSASADRSILLWKISPTGCQLLSKYDCHEVPLTVDFFQNQIIAGYIGGVIRLWPLPSKTDAFTTASVPVTASTPVEEEEEPEEEVYDADTQQ
ncbi:hypothetical protein WA158_000008 [Blastocystis sp. Blastoise]